LIIDTAKLKKYLNQLVKFIFEEVSHGKSCQSLGGLPHGMVRYCGVASARQPRFKIPEKPQKIYIGKNIHIC
jgi:hypothetical protein